MAAGNPLGETQFAGMAEQDRGKALGCRQIAGVERHRACRLCQCVTKRYRVSLLPGVFNGEPGGLDGLIGKAEAPEDARQVGSDRNPGVHQKTHNPRMRKRWERTREMVLQAAARIGLIAENMQCDSGHAVADRQIGQLATGRRKLLELLGKRQCHSIGAGVHAIGPQAPQRQQLVFRVAKALGDFQSPRQGGLLPWRPAGGIVQ